MKEGIDSLCGGVAGIAGPHIVEDNWSLGLGKRELLLRRVCELAERGAIGDPGFLRRSELAGLAG